MTQIWPAISLVIPMFNEAKRVDKMFNVLVSFSRKWTGLLQVILVDDGSTDLTKTKVTDFVNSVNSTGHATFEIVSYRDNKGKGYALKMGVNAVKYAYFITLDADMAADPNNLFTWFSATGINPQTIYIGSREHQQSEVKDMIVRRLAGRLFNYLVRYISGLPFLDTQCGFKWYPKSVGFFLFEHLQADGWIHDVELLMTAALLDIKVQEMPVVWDYQPNSKLKLWQDGFITVIQLIRVRLSLLVRRRQLKLAFLHKP